MKTWETRSDVDSPTLPLFLTTPQALVGLLWTKVFGGVRKPRRGTEASIFKLNVSRFLCHSLLVIFNSTEQLIMLLCISN